MLAKWILINSLLVLFLLCLILLLPGEASALAFPTQKWHYDTAQGFEHSAVAIGNIDNSPDGSNEIIIGNIDGKVYCFNQNGVLQWTRQTGGWVNSTAALADCDGNGTLEIFIGSLDGYLYGLNYMGEDLSMWGWPKYVDGDGQGGGVFSSPAIADLDGDGDKEVVVGTYKHWIWAWHYQGGVVSGWPLDNHDSIWSSPAVGDIDLDGNNEVVIGADCWSDPGWYPRGGLIWALNGHGKPLPGWPKLTPQVIWSSPAIGDVDGDGFPDIVVGTGTFWTGIDGRKVYGLRYDGTDLPGWPVTTGDDVFSSPALGDVDNDGKLEAAVGANDGYLYLINDDGSLIWKKADTVGGHLLGSPVMGDVDGDGQTEVVIGSEGWVCAWKYDGSAYYDFYLNYVTMGTPGLADIDNDNKAEVLFGTGYQSGPGRLWAWEENGTYSASRFPWPVFRGDQAHTACAPRTEPADPNWQVASSLYLAEGYTDNSFDEYLLLMNPQDTAAQVHIRFQFTSGKTAVRTLTLAANSRETIKVDDIASHHNVSVKVLSDKQIIAERSMYFSYNGKDGGHNSIGAASPSTTWYLAEGYTGGDFDEWILVQNPNSSDAHLNVTYSVQGGGPIWVSYTVPANSRYSIHVDEAPYLGNAQVSAKIDSDQPVIAERSMYFNYEGKDGGHNSIGVTSPNTTWYLAEGYTGGDYDEYILIQNPSDQAANAVVTFYVKGGEPLYGSYAIPANSRYTIHVDEFPYLGNAEVSAKVHSTNGVGIIAERSMYFNDNGRTDGHDSVGVTSPASTWYLAEGYTGGDFDEWILVQNPNSSDAHLNVTYYVQGGRPIWVSYTVPANSRYSIHVDEAPYLGNAQVSAKIESDQQIIAERSMYFNYEGKDGGHNSVGFAGQ